VPQGCSLPFERVTRWLHCLRQQWPRNNYRRSRQNGAVQNALGRRRRPVPSARDRGASKQKRYFAHHHKRDRHACC